MLNVSNFNRGRKMDMVDLQNATLNLFCRTQSALKMHFEFWQTVQIKLKANFKLDCHFVPFKKLFTEICPGNF